MMDTKSRDAGTSTGDAALMGDVDVTRYLLIGLREQRGGDGPRDLWEIARAAGINDRDRVRRIAEGMAERGEIELLGAPEGHLLAALTTYGAKELGADNAETDVPDHPDAPPTPAQRGGRIEPMGSDDPIDQAAEESFPASDPPSYTPNTSIGPPSGG